MITSVTTTTVATVGALAGPLGAASVVILLALLVQKELASTYSASWVRVLGRILNIAIIPLLLAFAFSVVMKILTILAE